MEKAESQNLLTTRENERSSFNLHHFLNIIHIRFLGEAVSAAKANVCRHNQSNCNKRSPSNINQANAK